MTGCTMAPKYKQPAAPVPAAWHTGLPEPEPKVTAGAPAAQELKWKEFFTDKNLQQVIDLALKNNRDLRIAALNVERVQAQYRIQRAQLYPRLDAVGGGQIVRVPEKSFGNSGSFTFREYQFEGSTSWELDLFGRIRSLKKQAQENYFATEQARSATQISLVAAVTNSYLNLAADREKLRLAQATLDSQQASYNLVLRKRDTGIASDLDLSEARSQVEAAQVDITRYSGQITLDENALNLLVGAPVPANLLPEKLGSDSAMKEISAGLRSDVLLRRPDILQAEHQLKAAYANIGVARAAFFPQLSLTANGGLMSSSLSDLFNSASGAWSFAPQIVTPVFDAGVRKANLKIAKVDRDAALAEYEKAIQTGFREVSDSLSQRGRLTTQQNDQQALVNTLEETYNLADARYKAGIDSYLGVLVTQRSLYAAQQILVNVRLARLGNLVTLYKVLGGGA